MTTDVAIVAGSWGKWWPSFVAGFCGPLLGFLLARWLPFHFAMGTAFFVVWFFAWLIFAKRSPPKWGLPGWFVAVLTSAASGLAVGLLSYFFPWN